MLPETDTVTLVAPDGRKVEVKVDPTDIALANDIGVLHGSLHAASGTWFDDAQELVIRGERYLIDAATKRVDDVVFISGSFEPLGLPADDASGEVRVR